MWCAVEAVAVLYVWGVCIAERALGLVFLLSPEKCRYRMNSFGV